jgi:hypothetical protein
MSRFERMAMKQRSRDQAVTRRELIQSFAAAIGAVVVVAAAWLVSRDAPSAGSDPGFTPPAMAPSRTAPAATPPSESG